MYLLHKFQSILTLPTMKSNIHITLLAFKILLKVFQCTTLFKANYYTKNQLLCLDHDRLCRSIFLRRRTKEQNLRENVYQLLNTVWRMLITRILYIFALLNFPQIHKSPQSNYNGYHEQLRKKRRKRKTEKKQKDEGISMPRINVTISLNSSVLISSLAIKDLTNWSVANAQIESI